MEAIYALRTSFSDFTQYDFSNTMHQNNHENKKKFSSSLEHRYLWIPNPILYHYTIDYIMVKR